MKDELQGKLVEILTGIQGAVSKGSDFVLTQLPDVAQSYIAFGRAWSVFAVVAAFIAFVTSAYIAIQYGFKDKSKDMDVQIPAQILGTVAAIFSAVFFITWLREALLVWFAPKVWLLIEIADLIRRHH